MDEAQSKRPGGAGGKYLFGVFELNVETGELRRKGMRVRLHAQPFAILCMLVERPGEMLTREEICRVLWPEGTFVDYEHGVNSALNRLREALGDSARNPQFVETLARRGYRFLAPVERLGTTVTEATAVPEVGPVGMLGRVLAGPDDLPETPPEVARVLFVLLQVMYLGFYVGALANLAEVRELLAALPYAGVIAGLVTVSAAVMITVRTFVLCAVVFRAPGLRTKLLRLWPLMLLADLVWALSPMLLLHHMTEGLVLACMPLLVYAPFAQRSLVLMGAGEEARPGKK